MTRKIAIIISRDNYCYEDYSKVIDSITDWAEVNDDEYKALKQAAPRNGFEIIEQPVDYPAFIKKTVADYLAFAKAEEERLEAERKKREDAALARRMKKELKTKESKRKLFEKLREELGEQ